MGQIPHFKSSDASLLKIAEPFGKVRRYFLNRSRNEVIKCEFNIFFSYRASWNASWVNKWDAVEITYIFCVFILSFLVFH